MNRPDFLRNVGALIAVISVRCTLIVAGAIPAFAMENRQELSEGVARTTSLDPKTSEAHASVLASAIARAKSRGLPLLILRFPDVEASRYMLGRMWGTYFSLATFEMLEDLALCEFVCAPDEQVVRELPDVKRIKEWTSGIALLLDPGESSPHVIVGSIEIPPWWKDGVELRDDMRRMLDEIHVRLHAWIAPDKATIERRARQNRESLTPAELAELGPLSSRFEVDSWRRYAERLPAWLLLEAMSHETKEHNPVVSLFSQAGGRLESAPSGSRWLRPTDECTRKARTVFYTEGCSMPGAQPLPGARFLQFLAQSDENANPHPRVK